MGRSRRDTPSDSSLTLSRSLGINHKTLASLGHVVWTALVIPALCGLFASGTWAKDSACERIAALHSVEISKDGRGRDGTGVVITSDGYILTARHVVVSGAAGSTGLEAPLEVTVNSSVVGQAVRARVVDIHQYIDLALLKITVPPDAFPKPIQAFTETDGLKGGTPVCLGGFGVQQDSTGQVISYEPLKAIPASFRETSRGYLLSGAPIPVGFSGGGLFIGEKLLGVNIRREMAGTATLSVPIGQP
jgi:S1-C subfamily serine protease